MSRLCTRRFAICDWEACANECAQERIERALADLATSYPEIVRSRDHLEAMRREAEEMLVRSAEAKALRYL